MLKKIVAASMLCAALLGFSKTSHAQYENALGMRVEFGSGGALYGFSGKHFFTNHHAGEAQLLFGTGVTVLDLEYQYHAPIGGERGLQWYAGFGLATAFGSNGGGTDFFMRPIAGLDYKINNAPINLAFDWRPTILLSNDNGGGRFTAGRFGLAVRYAF